MERIVHDLAVYGSFESKHVLPASFWSFRRRLHTAKEVIRRKEGLSDGDSRVIMAGICTQIQQSSLWLFVSALQILTRPSKGLPFASRSDSLRLKANGPKYVTVEPFRGDLRRTMRMNIRIHKLKMDGPVVSGAGNLTLDVAPARQQAHHTQSDRQQVKDNTPSSLTSTSSSSTLWRYWLDRCVGEHQTCSRSRLNAFVPKRLIRFETGNVDDRMWRVIVSDPTVSVEYLTLSHCWGRFTGLKLTQNTFAACSSGLKASELGKTFIDALDITAKLGYNHIWIDSLCIFQDDLADWREQAPLMARIYAGAVCNIGATWAADDSHGCYRSRDPSMAVHASLQLKLSQSDHTSVEVYDRWSYTDDISAAPLNTRGWVVQERFLASRQLNFASNQVYWECKELSACEQFPYGLPPGIADGVKPTFNSTSTEEIRRAWCTAVQMYTRSTLTHRSDRLIAISGLATVFRERTQDVYVAGLWESNLIKQLCWKALRNKHHEAISPYQGPSWSWTGISGPVQMDYRWHDTGFEGVSLAKVTDLKYETTSVDGLDEFHSCRLQIQGIALWAEASDTGYWSTKFSPQPDSTILSHFKLAAADIYWDRGPDWESIPNEFADENGIMRFLFIHMFAWGRSWRSLYDEQEWDFAQGLVLRQSQEEPMEFVKVGTFETPRSEALASDVTTRLDMPSVCTEDEDLLNLDDARLADLMRTVWIV